MSKNTVIGSVVTVAVIAVIVISVIAFGPGSSTVEGLEGVEILEYQGEDLSSINDFRENSIAGPQYINIKDYK